MRILQPLWADSSVAKSDRFQIHGMPLNCRLNGNDSWGVSKNWPMVTFQCRSSRNSNSKDDFKSSAKRVIEAGSRGKGSVWIFAVCLEAEQEGGDTVLINQDRLLCWSTERNCHYGLSTKVWRCRASGLMRTYREKEHRSHCHRLTDQ